MNKVHTLATSVAHQVHMVSAHAEPLMAYTTVTTAQGIKLGGAGWVKDTTYLRRLLDALFMTI